MSNGLILIDSWGFTIRVARAIRAAQPNVPLIKYVGPQVWASRPGRANPHGVVFLDLVDRPSRSNQGASNPAFRARRGIAPEASLLLVLPGSRAANSDGSGPPRPIRSRAAVWAAACSAAAIGSVSSRPTALANVSGVASS